MQTSARKQEASSQADRGAELPPNPMARGLVTGRTYSIGLVVPDLLHPFYAEIAKGLCRLFRKKGYALLISSSEEDPSWSGRELSTCSPAAWTGHSGFEPNDGGELSPDRGTEDLVRADRPEIRRLEANFVGVDDELVGRMATEHLLERGCRCIAHIRGPQVSTAAGRLEVTGAHSSATVWRCFRATLWAAVRATRPVKRAATRQCRNCSA